MICSQTHLVPSPWVMQQALLWPEHGRVLDFASGRGRHSRLLAERFHILAVDRDADAKGAADKVRLEAEEAAEE